MRHRIFIAINLPEKIKNKLVSDQEEIERRFDVNPMRWTKKDNLHITLVFLGYILDDEILEIIEKTKKTALQCDSFLIKLNKICYGPPEKTPPKMIWAKGEENKKLTELKNNLEINLMNSETRVFSPHITLAKIRAWQWRQIEPEERPEIEKEISLSFEVNSIDIMESQLKRQGPEYIMLESIELKN